MKRNKKGETKLLYLLIKTFNDSFLYFTRYKKKLYAVFFSGCCHCCSGPRHLCGAFMFIPKGNWENGVRETHEGRIMMWMKWKANRKQCTFRCINTRKKRVHNQVVAARLPNDYTVQFPKCLAEVWIERNDRTTESQCRDIHKSHSRLNSPAQTFYKTDTSSVSCFLINVCNARVPHSNAAATAAA